MRRTEALQGPCAHWMFLKWRSVASGLGLPGARTTWTGMFALRAKATIAFPPSQTNRFARVTTPLSAAAIEARSTFGYPASVVAPSRSRATRMRMFSKNRPACFALPPLLRRARGRSDLRPLNNSRMNVSSASTRPVSVLRLSSAREPKNPCRQRNAVVACTCQRSGHSPPLVASICLAVVEPGGGGGAFGSGRADFSPLPRPL